MSLHILQMYKLNYFSANVIINEDEIEDSPIQGVNKNKQMDVEKSDDHS